MGRGWALFAIAAPCGDDIVGSASILPACGIQRLILHADVRDGYDLD